MLILHADSQEATNVLVLLDGKPLKSYVRARCSTEHEEGWVEVVDLKQMLQLISFSENEEIKDEQEFVYDSESEDDSKAESLPVKVLKGKVEFIPLKT